MKKEYCFLIVIFMFILVQGISAQQVESDGSYSYIYPLSLPPGTGGIEPAITLTYNSNGGNGMCGLGFNLSGLPEITRDRSYGINFDEHDHYVFAGQRLIYSAEDVTFYTEKAGNFRITAYTAAGIQTAPTGDISYWVVVQKDGTKMYFGFNSPNHTTATDGHINAVGKGGKALLWALSIVEDVNGNFYYVLYEEDIDNGDYYPKKIVYTKGNGLSNEKIVDLLYEERTDHGQKYIPTYYDMDKRLKEIIVSARDTDSQTETIIHKYSLNYDYSDLSGKSILKSVDELSYDDSILKSTEFGWSDSQVAISSLGTYDTVVSKSEAGIPAYFLPGDYNGDGRNDIVYARGQGTGKNRYEFYIYLGTTSGGLSYSTKFDTNLSLSEAGIPGHFVTGDYNGDGRTDIVYARGQGTGTDRYEFYIYLGTAAGGLEYNGFYDTVVSKSEAGIPAHFLPGDYNGDGRTDIIYARGQGTGKDRYEFYIYLGTTSGSFNFIGFYDTDLSLSEAGIPGHFVTGDYNGDGRSDIVYARGQGTGTDRYQFFIYLGTASGNLEYLDMYDTVVSKSEAGIPAQFIPGDYNGDGRTDIIYARGQGTGTDRYEFYIYLGTTGGNFKFIGYYDTAMSLSEAGIPGYFLPGDYNGDGRTDIIYARGQGTGLNRYQFYKYQGEEDGYLTRVESYDTNRIWQEGDIPTHLVAGDYNGDGKANIIMARGETDGTDRYVFFMYKESIPNQTDQITSIKNNHGGTTLINYTPAPQVPGAVDSTKTAYPCIANSSPRQLVTSLRVNDGMGTESSTSYKYSNGMFYTGYRDKRRNTGFEWTKNINNATGSYVVTEYYHKPDNIRFQGLVKRQTTFDNSNNKYKETLVTYKYRQELAAASGYHAVDFIFKDNEYIYNYNGTSTAETYRIQYGFYDASGNVISYDAYGNLLKKTNHGNVNVAGDEITEITEYIIDEENYIMVPKNKRINAFNLDNQWVTASLVNYYYDNQPYDGINGKGLCTKKEEMVKTGEWIVSEFDYDSNGRLTISQDPLAASSGYNSKVFAYDGYDPGRGQYYDTMTNALGMTGYTYYDEYLRPVETVDVNGVSWFVAYDEFGRVTRTWGPGESEMNPGTITEYYNAVVEESTGEIISPGYTISRVKDGSADGWLWTYTYGDGLGRKIQVKTEAAGGQWRTVDSYYNESGKNDKTSVPYYTSTSAFTLRDETQKCTRLEYDKTGRVIKTIHTDGTVTRVVYKKKKTISIDAKNHAVSKEVSGNTTTDTVYAEEYPEQNPDPQNPYSTATTISACNGTRIIQDENELQTRTDMLGRKESYTDPDMGTWTYTYDDNGNLSTQTDAKGGAISFDYDRLDRVRHKYYNAVLNSTYLYDGLDDAGNPDGEDHGPCAGLLTKVIYPGGEESYTYDNRGRATAIKKTIDGRERLLTTTYDSLDRIVSETYPGGEIVTYSYGDDGNLVSVTGNRNGDIADYAGAMTYTAQGKLQAIYLGNGITSTYDYYDDAAGDPANQGRTHSSRLRSIHMENSAGLCIAHTEYHYDPADNIVSKDFYDDFNSFYTENYTYDHAGRLVQADAPDLYGFKEYNYAPNNNILEKDGRNYLYAAEVDGRILPHAVSEVQDEFGNPLFTYTYDANGNMISAQGMSKITIRARGTGVSAEPPVMELWLAGEKRMRWAVTNEEYREYTWFGYWDGSCTVDIVFANDNQSGGEETDLFIDWVELNGVKKQAEDLTVTCDQGPYSAGCFDGVDVISGQEQMTTTGALRFGFIGILTINRTIEYDEENRMTRIEDNGSDTSFAYDDGGQRIKKTENGVTTYYFFGNYEETVEGGNTKEISYYFANGQRIAQRTTTETESELLYVHTDHLGSAVRLTDENGDIVQSTAYDPFGMTVYSAGATGTAYQFTGQELDGGTGLYYYNARYYDPVLGRFIQADTVLDGLNRYTYCGNSPVMYTDPSGNFIVPLCIGIGAAIGVYVGGVLSNSNYNPTQWDWGSANTYVGMGIGGIVGGALGFVAGSMITGGIAGVTPYATLSSESGLEIGFNITMGELATAGGITAGTTVATGGGLGSAYVLITGIGSLGSLGLSEYLSPDKDTGNIVHNEIEFYLSQRYHMNTECYTKGREYRLDAISFLGSESMEVYEIKPISWINNPDKCMSYMNSRIRTVNRYGLENAFYNSILNSYDGATAGTRHLNSLNGKILNNCWVINSGGIKLVDIQLITNSSYAGYIFYKCYNKNPAEELVKSLAFSLMFMFSGVSAGNPIPAF